MKNIFKCTLFVPFFLYMATTIGCSSTANEKTTHTEWCKKRYESAEELYKAQKYGRAIEKLEGILSTCAGSGYMEQTQFLLGESHFNLEQWIEARGEYGSFVINFPGSAFAETAEYRKAVSSFKMEYKVDRDESNTTTAMKDFERYLANYPNTPLRDSVNYYYDLLVNRVAEKEFQTGRLYLRMDKPQAAVIYFKEFLETYPKAKRRQETLFLISSAYTDLDQFDAARQYLDIAENEAEGDQNVIKRSEKAKAKIAKAEENYEKRLQKEAEKKRIQKEEKNMVN